MATTHAAACAAPPVTVLDRLNGPGHELALRIFMVIVLVSRPTGLFGKEVA